MREPAQKLRRKTHFMQKFGADSRTLLGGIGKMHLHALLYDRRNGHAGIQTGIRILKDHLVHFQVVPLLRLGHGILVLPVIKHFSGGLLVYAQQGAAAGGFAAAGFPHQRKGLSLTDLKTDIVYSLYHSPFAGEVPAQALHLIQDLGIVHSSLPPMPSGGCTLGASG